MLLWGPRKSRISLTPSPNGFTSLSLPIIYQLIIKNSYSDMHGGKKKKGKGLKIKKKVRYLVGGKAAAGQKWGGFSCSGLSKAPWGGNFGVPRLALAGSCSGLWVRGRDGFAFIPAPAGGSVCSRCCTTPEARRVTAGGVPAARVVPPTPAWAWMAALP